MTCDLGIGTKRAAEEYKRGEDEHSDDERAAQGDQTRAHTGETN